MTSSSIPHAVLWHGRTLGPDDPVLVEFIGAAEIAPIDQITVDGAMLKTQELAELKLFANLSPHLSRYKLVMITHADQLSSVVANGLLKLIEEPPTHLLIRLNADRVSAVLPTIRSRCQLVNLPSAIVTDDRFPLANVAAMTLTDQFALAETLAKDERLEAVVYFWLTELETALLRGEPVDASIELAQTLINRLRTNSSRRLALESWFIARFAANQNQ